MNNLIVITLNINNEKINLAVEEHHTLAEILREKLYLTGTKMGCDKGDCGACTVLIDNKPALSCLTLINSLNENAKIKTIEGLADSNGLNNIQKAFMKCGALQCGFCQPGIMLSARALLNNNKNPSLYEIKKALNGNLCRCTGYTKIYKAIQLASDMEKKPTVDI